MFDSDAYPLKFVQRNRFKDESGNLLTFIYKFFSVRNGLMYVLRIECLGKNLFALKFYCKKDRKSDVKYQKVTNRGDVPAILKTCLSVISEILQHYPEASFCFIASRSLDKDKRLREEAFSNQLFRVYRYFIIECIGVETFTHFASERVSGYLLLNKCYPQPEVALAQMKKLLSDTYPDLGDLT